VLKQQEEIIQADIDTHLLSDFIYDLNIARRKLTLYPENHPQIANSCTIVVNILKKLCQFREEITLGIAPDALLFEQNWLDESNPVYRDCARFFSIRNVASISFRQTLEVDELIRFNQILSRDKQILEAEGGLAVQVEHAQIKNIVTIPVDYSHFQMGNTDLNHTEMGLDGLWETFLHGLIKDKLDQGGQVAGLSDSLDAELVAQILNQSSIQNSGKRNDYNQTISSFVSKLNDNSNQANNEMGEQLNTLISNLTPDLKRDFLNSTFKALGETPEVSDKLLASLPQELITESLAQHNCEQLNISTRLVDLLGQFSTTTSQHGSRNVKALASPLSDEILKARVEILLLEDNHDEYIPNDYQKALSKILTGQVKSNIEQKVAQRLQKNLKKQSVERQCCAILFNMLNNRVTPEIELQIQDNLSELARFFLETGDFISLQEIFISWSAYLYSGNANARFLDEKVLADQTRESFMNEVLESIELWGQDKYDEVCHYINEIGEPYAELLIERLGREEQMSLRKTWMKILVELGSKGHQIILQTLNDKRWFLVRNLLIVLGQQRDAIPMKAVHQLTNHTHPKVRQEALRIIFRHNPATANRMLLKELSSGDKEALFSAIQLAECSQDAKVLHQLHQLIQAEIHSEEELRLKKQILDTLAYLRKPESIPVLAKLLKRKGFIRSRRQKEFQQEIIKRLGAYPQQASEPLINSIINGRDRTHIQLAKIQLQNYKTAEVRS
jgi:hypothetical protein